jgi:hypothetical protein
VEVVVANIGFPLSIVDKQKVLFGTPLPPAALVELGDRYAGMDLWHDALDFYEGAQDRSRLEKTASLGVETADLVLYLNARRAMGEAPDADALARLRSRAVEMGREATIGRVDLLVVPSKD